MATLELLKLEQRRKKLISAKHFNWKNFHHQTADLLKSALKAISLSGEFPIQCNLPAIPRDKISQLNIYLVEFLPRREFSRLFAAKENFAQRKLFEVQN
jgi:hypothetical protein